MKKLAIVSIVLLLAGIGLALGQMGSCNFQSNAACPQTGCAQNCGSSCPLGISAASPCAPRYLYLSLTVEPLAAARLAAVETARPAAVQPVARQL